MFELRRGDSLVLGGKFTYRTGEPPAEAPLPAGTTLVCTICKVDSSTGKLGPRINADIQLLDVNGAYRINVDEAVTIGWKEGDYVLEIEVTFPGADPKVYTMPHESFVVTRRIKALPVTP